MRTASPEYARATGAVAFLATALVFSMGFAAPAQATPDPVCAASGVELYKAAVAAVTRPQLRPELLYAYSAIPLQGDVEFAISGKLDDKRITYETTKDVTLRALVTDARSVGEKDEAKWLAKDISGLSITPFSAAPVDPLVVKERIKSGDLMVGFTVPSLYPNDTFDHRFFDDLNVVVIGCGGDGKARFITQQISLPMSGRWSSLIFSVVPGFFFYCLFALAARSFDEGFKVGNKTPSEKDSPIRSLDPVRMSSGPNGKGSLARLQIMFFTMLMVLILAFLIFRVGFLSDMSPTILYLLGISAVGAAAAKGTDMAQTRLTPENWAWLTSREWLPKCGLGPYTTAKWRDLVTSEDGFDVYHFQMLMFSLVVALALLSAGYGDIAHFEIPENLLGVLGLSQVAYVGGKIVSPPSYRDLDKLLTELRGMEDEYVVLKTQEDAAGTARTADMTAKTKAAADNFKRQMKKVESYFVTVFGSFDEIRRKVEGPPVASAPAAAKRRILTFDDSLPM